MLLGITHKIGYYLCSKLCSTGGIVLKLCQTLKMNFHPTHPIGLCLLPNIFQSFIFERIVRQKLFSKRKVGNCEALKGFGLYQNALGMYTCQLSRLRRESHACGLKLRSHACSRLRANFSRLIEKCELLPSCLTQFPKICQLRPM